MKNVIENVIAVVGGILLVGFLVFVLCRYLDKKNEEKIGMLKSCGFTNIIYVTTDSSMYKYMCTKNERVYNVLVYEGLVYVNYNGTGELAR